MEERERPVNAEEMPEDPQTGGLLLEAFLHSIQAVPVVGDHRNDQGILICGKCGKPKERIYEANGTRYKIRSQCACEKKKAEEIAAERERAAYHAKYRRIRNASMMGARYEYVSFDSLTIDDSNRRAVQIAKRYVERFKEMEGRNQGLLLYGENCGTGKSIIAACIANALQKKLIPVVFTSCGRLIRMMQDGEEKQSDLFRFLSTVPLLILDDLGSERYTDFMIEQIESIINERYTQNKPLIVTSNLTPKEMLEEDRVDLRRIYDRITQDLYPVELGGISRRKQDAARRFEETRILLEG